MRAKHSVYGVIGKSITSASKNCCLDCPAGFKLPTVHGAINKRGNNEMKFVSFQWKAIKRFCISKPTFADVDEDLDLKL